MSAEEERELAERIQRGDMAARDHLVLANLRLVPKIVRKYQGGALSREDLVQEGNLGLMRASQDFNPSAHNTRFSSYAAIWINAFAYRAVTANSSMVRAPQHVVRLRAQLQKATAALEAEANAGTGADKGETRNEPALEQIAEELGVSLRRLKACEHAPLERHAPLTIDDEAGPASLADGLIDHRRPDEEAIEHEEQLLLDAALRGLNPVEAWLLCERFGLSTTAPEAQNWAGSGPGPGGPTPDGREASARPGRSGARRAYFHRTYVDLQRECALGPERLHQVERAALDKLKRVLGPYLASAS